MPYPLHNIPVVTPISTPHLTHYIRLLHPFPPPHLKTRRKFTKNFPFSAIFKQLVFHWSFIYSLAYYLISVAEAHCLHFSAIIICHFGRNNLLKI